MRRTASRAGRAPTGERLHVARSPIANLIDDGAGGQALGGDMSGGPRGLSIFAREALRPGPKVRAWRPQGPAHPQLPRPTKGEAASAAGHIHSLKRMNRFDDRPDHVVIIGHAS